MPEKEVSNIEYVIILIKKVFGWWVEGERMEYDRSCIKEIIKKAKRKELRKERRKRRNKRRSNYYYDGECDYYYVRFRDRTLAHEVLLKVVFPYVLMCVVIAVGCVLFPEAARKLEWWMHKITVVSAFPASICILYMFFDFFFFTVDDSQKDRYGWIE